MKKSINSDDEPLDTERHSAIYDGTFAGKLISGTGLFAKALKEIGVTVGDVEDFNTEIFEKLNEQLYM